MPLINKQPFKPNPIPDNLGPDDEVFYHELTNEIFTDHDAFFDRFLFCNSLIWTCSKTGKSGLTYKEALDSEEQGPEKKKGKRQRSSEEVVLDDNGEPIKKKKKKYPYDPKKYSMPVPEGFDPSLLTPTGKIDGRKLKSKKNKQIAEELLSHQALLEPTSSTSGETKPKKGKHKGGDEEDVRRKEEASKKAQAQAELAREKELEAKRKKEAAAQARQLERQKKEEERKKATAFLQNWEKKCEDLERDDLRRLPQPIPVDCDIPERLFGDAIFILEALYNLHELYNFNTIFPEGISYDTLEEMLIDRQEDGPLGSLLQFILRLIFDTQPTRDGYGLDDDPTKNSTNPQATDASGMKQENNPGKQTNANKDGDHEHETTGSESDDDEENVDKDVNMNDLIGSAIKAAQEVKKSLSKPLPEMELNSTNMTEILRLHLLQSGSFPKGRTIYNGWYSSREDPGLWLCMQEPDLIKKLGEGTIYDLEIEERIKILHTLIYQLFSFIKTRIYIESASEQLTELRKQYRSDAAAFARWDRENCVKRMQPPKRKNEQNCSIDNKQSSNTSTNTNTANTATNGHHVEHQGNLIKSEYNQSSYPGSLNGDLNGDNELGDGGVGAQQNDKDNQQQLKSCLKTNGISSSVSSNNLDPSINESEDVAQKKKITFKTAMENNNGAIVKEENGLECENEHDDKSHIEGVNPEESDQTFEEQERAYQQNQVDYEDYQRERAIKLEELNETLLSIRSNIRTHQSIYGIHPIGRDRAYRRYWLYQSLPGLFVEHDDEYVGKCLSQPTPLESMYKKLFNKDNPLMHTNESDLIRTKTHDVGCSTADSPPSTTAATTTTTTNSTTTGGDVSGCEKEEGAGKGTSSCDQDGDPSSGNSVSSCVKIEKEQQPPQDADGSEADNLNEGGDDNNPNSDRLASSDAGQDEQEDKDDHHYQQDQQNHQESIEFNGVSDEMNYCTGDESTCAIHGQRRNTQPRWWFYHLPESVDRLVECLNKRGHRESELQEVLSVESRNLKPWITQCPAHKLNKTILEQSGIRRSRRLKTKGGKRRGRARVYDE